MKGSSGYSGKDMPPRANSRQDNRHIAHDDSTDITRQLQYMTEGKPASRSKLSGRED